MTLLFLFLSVLYLKFVIKRILLHDARKASVPRQRKAFRIVCVEHLPDMRVDGKGVDMVQTEQADALRNLDAHAGQSKQLRFRVRVLHAAYPVQLDRARGNLPRRGTDVFRAVAEPDRRKLLGRALREALRRRKGMIDLAVRVHFRLAEQGAQVLDTFRDARNVILLRNDKADNGFPDVLPQDAQAASGLHRRLKIAVAECDFRLVASVIRVQIKIIPPERLKFVLAAGKTDRITVLLDFEPFPARNQRIPPLALPAEAEALAGGGNLLDVEIR